MNGAATHHNGPEPTLYDVMEILVRMDERMENVEEEIVEVKDRLRGVERATAELTGVVEDLQEHFLATSRAVDTDAVTIIDHEARIRQLEAARAGR